VNPKRGSLVVPMVEEQFFNVVDPWRFRARGTHPTNHQMTARADNVLGPCADISNELRGGRQHTPRKILQVVHVLQHKLEVMFRREECESGVLWLAGADASCSFFLLSEAFLSAASSTP